VGGCFFLCMAAGNVWVTVWMNNVVF